MNQPTARQDDRPTERVTTLVPPRLLARIRAEAQHKMISLSAVIRQKLAESYQDKPES